MFIRFWKLKFSVWIITCFENILIFGTAWSNGHVRSALRRAWLGIWVNGSRHCVHLAELCRIDFYFPQFGFRMTFKLWPKIRDSSQPSELHRILLHMLHWSCAGWELDWSSTVGYFCEALKYYCQAPLGRWWCALCLLVCPAVLLCFPCCCRLSFGSSRPLFSCCLDPTAWGKFGATFYQLK